MTTPAHLFLFITGNPTEFPAQFIAEGHFTMNTETGVSQGNVTIRDIETEWITQISIISFEFDDETEIFNGTAEFDTVKGNPPFPETLPLGPLLVGELIQAEGNPNLFTLIAAGSPPPV